MTAWIPFDKLHLSHYSLVLVERAVSTLIAILAMRIFYPRALVRIRQRVTTKRLLIVVAIIAFFALPPLRHSGLSSQSGSLIIKGFVFALFIGIDEEFFSRGFIFAAFEEYGVSAAAILSSLHFGTLHLGNALWGGQSLSYTSAQVLSAAAVGYLLAGLMLFTGSIRIPILLHGLIDTPMQFQAPAKYLHMVAGNPNWIAVVLQSTIYFGIGWLLIQFSGADRALRLTFWLKNIFFV